MNSFELETIIDKFKKENNIEKRIDLKIVTLPPVEYTYVSVIKVTPDNNFLIEIIDRGLKAKEIISILYHELHHILYDVINIRGKYPNLE